MAEQKQDNGKKRRPPEWERYDELKGKRVRVVFHDDSTMMAVLRWVDRYTIGLQWARTVQHGGSVQTGREQVWIINKAWIVMIGEAE